MRLALSKLEKNLLRLHSWGRRSDWAVSYCTDQLLTPNFSGGSTLNGTPGGDRWARVICGNFIWLSESLHRDNAERSGCTNLKIWLPEKHGKKVRPTQNTPRNPQQPGDRDPSRQRAKHHVPRVSPYSLASIDTGFVDIGLVQLSQSVKTTNIAHLRTDTQTS